GAIGTRGLRVRRVAPGRYTDTLPAPARRSGERRGHPDPALRSERLDIPLRWLPPGRPHLPGLWHRRVVAAARTHGTRIRDRRDPVGSVPPRGDGPLRSGDVLPAPCGGRTPAGAGPAPARHSLPRARPLGAMAPRRIRPCARPPDPLPALPVLAAGVHRDSPDQHDVPGTLGNPARGATRLGVRARTVGCRPPARPDRDARDGLRDGTSV